MNYYQLHGTNIVNLPQEFGIDTIELVPLFELRSDGLHIRYEMDNE